MTTSEENAIGCVMFILVIICFFIGLLGGYSAGYVEASLRYKNRAKELKIGKFVLDEKDEPKFVWVIDEKEIELWEKK